MSELPRNVALAQAEPVAIAGVAARWRARLHDLIQLIGRWKIIIFSIFAVMLVVGLLITVLMTSQFTAVARVEVRPGHKKIINAQGAIVETADVDTDFYNTQFYLLSAHSLAEKVALVMRLPQNEDFFRAHGDSVPGKAQRGAPAQLAEREQLAISLLEQHVKVVPVEGTALIDVFYTSRSPRWSADIANAWVRQFIGAGMDRRSALTADARLSLETRLQELRQRIEESEENARLYATRAGIAPMAPSSGSVKASPGQRLASRDLLAANDALQEAEVRRAAALNRAKIIGSRRLALASGGSTLAALRAKRAEVAADYARLSIQFKPAYPPLSALGQELRSLDHNIALEERRTSAAVAAEQTATARLAQQLRGEVGSLKARVDMQNHDSIQYEIYRRDAETNRQLYEATLQRYKQLSAAVLGATDVVVVDPAIFPEKPSSPRLFVNMALALLAATILAGIIVYFLEQRDHAIRDPADVEKQLDVPLLGVVRDLPADMVQSIISNSEASLPDPYLEIWEKLKTSGTAGARSLMITSTQPEEGSSTTALMLAIAAARAGSKVALADADMRHPSLHKLLGVRNRSGLSNFLAGEEDLKSLLQWLERDGITFLAAGPVPPSAGDLLAGERFPALVDALSRDFDIILFDAPAMLNIADAVTISRGVGAVLFVVEANGAGVRAISSALEQLRDGDAVIEGAIVTKMGEQNTDYQYAKR